jgi:hypothetical protein
MSGDHNMHCSGNQLDIATYRINYDLAGWQKIADEHGHMCAPFGAILAVNALCDEVEKLRQRVDELEAACDSVCYARDNG